MYETCEIQQSNYLSPAFETISTVAIFANHLEYTDEKTSILVCFADSRSFQYGVIKLAGGEDTQHGKKLIETEFDDMQG